MSAPKTTNRWGLLGKLESVYGTYNAPATSDGILVVEAPDVAETPVHDGSRPGSSSGTGGMRARVAQSGFENAFDAIAEAVGGGAAYSASVKPSLDLLLRILGFQATLDTTASSEKYTYAPESSGFDAASFLNYVRGEEYATRGAYAESLSIESDGPDVPVWTFGVRGVRQAAPADAAIPTITGYPAGTNLPPKAEAISLDVNGVTSLVCRGFSLSYTRELAARRNDNTTGGHSGFTPGDRTIGLVLRVEQIALATFNPYTLRDAGTLMALGMDIGSVQYKRWKIDAAQAQLVSVDRDDDGPTGMWTLNYELKCSGPTADDDLTITFD